MAARREALEYLPEGFDEAVLSPSLPYEQLTRWRRNVAAAEGQKLGFPAGEDGRLHRILQGYAYPSFTGGVNTTFASEDAVAMWRWFQSPCEYVNSQATTYGFMEEPLRFSRAPTLRCSPTNASGSSQMLTSCGGTIPLPVRRSVADD